MKKINYLDTIKSPVITEKATGLSESNKVVFKVRDDASKKTIKKNIEKIFKVNVIKVNTITKKCGSTLTLGESGTTVAIASGATTCGMGRTGTVDWQTGSIKTTTFTAANGEGYFADTSSGLTEIALLKYSKSLFKYLTSITVLLISLRSC